jgi:hypothetical protein
MGSSWSRRRHRGQVTDSDHTRLLHALLTAVVDLDELPHPRHAGRVLLAAAVAGKSCSDDAVARAASRPVAAVREVLPTMLDRCLHVPALLKATVNRHPLGTTYTGIRLTGEGQRRVLLMKDCLTHWLL